MKKKDKKNKRDPGGNSPQVNLMINREISLLEFNRRVLQQSINNTYPLLERVKAIAIFASNMDEFFKVRIPIIKGQNKPLDEVDLIDFDSSTKIDKDQISNYLTTLNTEEQDCWKSVEIDLKKVGIWIKHYNDLSPTEKEKIFEFFDESLFPVLTPLAYDQGHPFPWISNLRLTIAITLVYKPTGEEGLALVELPVYFPRLIPLNNEKTEFILIEEIVTENINALFPGCKIHNTFVFRITRSDILDIADALEYSNLDLAEAVQENVGKRRFGPITRFEVDNDAPKQIVKLLSDAMNMDDVPIYRVVKPIGLTSLWEINDIDLPQLKFSPFVPILPVQIDEATKIFDIVQKKDVILLRPYQSYNEIIRFIDEATDDPDTKTIKITLFRIEANSELINTLIRAKRKGKQVTVVVEVRVQGGEENNIYAVKKLESEGITVIYGLVDLKIHAKLCLIHRQEENRLQPYLHISTGNYNEITSHIYTDIDFITSDEKMCRDAVYLFNILTGYGQSSSFKNLIVSPFTAKTKLLELIEREVDYGDKGYLIFKCNSLDDPEIIDTLYKASRSKVKIDLIIRGICCLRPGVPGISENIRVISIVGRFLEHSRIYYFHNLGNFDIYAGSADLTHQSLDNRIDIIFPIKDLDHRKYIFNQILDLQLNDNTTAYQLLSNGSYVKITAGNNQPVINSQELLLE